MSRENIQRYRKRDLRVYTRYQRDATVACGSNLFWGNFVKEMKFRMYTRRVFKLAVMPYVYRRMDYPRPRLYVCLYLRAL